MVDADRMAGRHHGGFRAAELLQLDGNGYVVARQAPVKQPNREAVVAWRSLALPSGAIAMLHQRAQASAISIKPGGYGHSGSNALGTVTSAVTVLASTAAPTASGDLAGMALAVDVAVSADGTKVALAAPGGAPSGPAVFLTSMSEFTQAKASITAFDPSIQLKVSAVAVAFDGQGRLIVQTREPAALYISSQAKPIALPGVSRYDLGHSLFHRATSVNLACSSCHPEAGEDGRVWNFGGTGLRRTQTLRGGILATLPFHWNGDFKTFGSLMTEVFTNRMSGPQLSAEEANAMAQWLNAQPAPAASQVRDPAAAERG